MARRLTMGLLCCTTAGAAALGISMNSQSDKPTPVANVSALSSNRADTLQRANRSQARTAPATKPSAKPAAKAAPAKPLPMPSIRGLSSTQVKMAFAIDAEGHHMGISRRGRVIAMATALQESNLKNYRSAVDHDSLGLFQQRPSSGWGTPRQLTNPTYAAHAFYAVLVRYKGSWGCLTCAAQKVQRSAFPSAYARHERFATQIIDALDKGRKF
jgi:hypothetical protein